MMLIGNLTLQLPAIIPEIIYTWLFYISNNMYKDGEEPIYNT